MNTCGVRFRRDCLLFSAPVVRSISSIVKGTKIKITKRCLSEGSAKASVFDLGPSGFQAGWIF